MPKHETSMNTFASDNHLAHTKTLSKTPTDKLQFPINISDTLLQLNCLLIPLLIPFLECPGLEFRSKSNKTNYNPKFVLCTSRTFVESTNQFQFPPTYNDLVILGQQKIVLHQFGSCSINHHFIGSFIN